MGSFANANADSRAGDFWKMYLRERSIAIIRAIAIKMFSPAKEFNLKRNAFQVEKSILILLERNDNQPEIECTLPQINSSGIRQVQKVSISFKSIPGFPVKKCAT